MSVAPTKDVGGRFCGTVGGFRLDAEFNLAPSGVTALSGPSGSGKTTLLRCMAGLTRLPGSFYVGDEVWQDPHRFVEPHRRSVGVVFQEASLLPISPFAAPAARGPATQPGRRSAARSVELCRASPSARPLRGQPLRRRAAAGGAAGALSQPRCC